jgi:hypothetical protein
MRTDRDAYPSGWAYKLHYGATEPDPPRTLDDGTIRRYDNSHEDTKGHERHVTPESEPEINETARVVDRDVKNVHGELSRLAQLGIIFFEEEGQSKRLVVWFDELVINLPLDPEAEDATAAAP